MTLLASTRTRFGGRHALIAPDGFVAAPLPGWQGAQAVVLISPQTAPGGRPGRAWGARFQQLLLLLDEEGGARLPASAIERFAFVLEGRLEVATGGSTGSPTDSPTGSPTDSPIGGGGNAATLEPGGFAFLPAGRPQRLRAASPCRLLLFERRYRPLAGHAAPPFVAGHRDEAPAEPFMGDAALRVQKLLPEAPAFDMAMNVMNFDPGAALPFVETHVNEHGLYMLSGGGIYRLEEAWYPVTRGDVIWMGPYCPQWFGALGRETAAYLLYKDVNRDFLEADPASGSGAAGT